MVVMDARDRAKVFLDTRLTAANMKEDDTITNAAFIVSYADPPYPLKLVFYGTKNIDIIFAVDTPTTTSEMDWDGSIIGYVEIVPIHIFTVDKTGITGTELRFTAEKELRRIVETYPIDPAVIRFRGLNRVSKNDRWMGGWILHSVTYNLTYERDKT